MNYARRALFWLALPLVVPQALLVRYRAPRFPVAEGPVSGSAGGGCALRLVGIGDSVIAGVGVGTTDRSVVARSASALAAKLDCRVEWQAVGRVGADAGEVAQELVPAVPAKKTDLWVVSVGVNDVTSLKSTRRWRADLEALLGALQAHSPDSVTVLLGVPPMGTFPLLPWPLRGLLGLRAASLDQVGKAVAESRDVLHRPYARALLPGQFSGDGYHPSPAGHQAIADDVAARAAPVLRARVWPPPSGG
jgi:lysophospholipase L1-like esterase